jgi:hypothetical protein
MMTIATAHFNTDTNRDLPGMGYGRATSAESRPPDWIVVPLTLEPICHVCSDNDPLKEEGRRTEPELGCACALRDAAAWSGGKMVPISTGLDAVCGFADYAAGITSETSLIYYDREGGPMLSQAFGQHMRRSLAQDRNRFGGRR